MSDIIKDQPFEQNVCKRINQVIDIYKVLNVFSS